MTHILGLSGSLRQRSYSRALLRAAQALVPGGVTLEPFELSPLPLYNQDLDVGEGPVSVAALRRAVQKADALLVVTPEYNHSVPGLLANAIDWASRPAFNSALTGKPVAVLGVGTGAAGGARAAAQLKLVFDATLSPVLPQRGGLYPHIGTKFSPDGTLTDEKTGVYLKGTLEALVAWAQRFERPV